MWDPSKYAVPWLKSAKLYGLADVDDAINNPDKARMFVNECPFGPSEKVVEAVTEAARKGNRYPGTCMDLRTRIGKLNGVGPEQVLLVGGSSEIIDMAMRVFLQPGDEVIIPNPTFSMYEIRATVVGGNPVIIDTKPPDLTYDTDAMLAAVNEKTKLIIVCNPNNPTGNFIDEDDLKRIVETGIPIFLDEAYLEFYPEIESKASWISKYPNIFTTHTFSKAYGLAGIRFGYMIGTPEMISLFEKVQITWSASVMSLAAADAILEHKEELDNKRGLTRNSIKFFCDELAKIPGVKPFHSHGNYMLVDASDTGKSSKEIVDHIYEVGFIIKPIPELHGRGGIFRITPGTEEQNQGLAKALTEYLSA
jgi:histidinol-phosphate aminotransferase